ncbi:uncharacterized protein A4U43_C03F26720 [Asparagus officinalis]|uniref:Two-component response regulator-like APRR1 n=1 Tax=Asparagus officinalis TaxID=4686 RepID=A0A5P1FD77_ASPOF|nr:two-component response regulator-like PRR1 isoform X2 [Asparagus officinalis]ONK76355.1 uncharacterized protein A4U43_C03F26720 [Asparagus officinalis]
MERSRRFLLDRSKVRILLCDNDAKSSQEIVRLLSNCSYQVTSVKTARQVIDVLTANGPDIDIILAEVDLPVAKGFKMLKYINRDKELRRIPIIMMSSQDEVSVVVKCLRLGAADYLVKPLRMNELLNLWTHMWRRRRMLGLTEKDVVVHDLELANSDPSDAHTNSTIALSDDTDAKPSEGICQDLNVADVVEHQENEPNISPLELAQKARFEKEACTVEDSDLARSFSCPKKTDLKVGESSAFLTYVKSSVPTSNGDYIHVSHNSAPSGPLSIEENHLVRINTESHSNSWRQESYPNRSVYVSNGENMCNVNRFPMPMKIPVICVSSSNTQPQSRSEGQCDVSGIHPMFPFPVFLPGMMDQNMMASSTQMHNAPAIIPQYNALPQIPHVPLMPPFSYRPVGINLQSGRVAIMNSSAHEVNFGRTERRVAALIKFKQKRKDRCFDKKIRYINRKKLAEKRPRVRGQFVRQVNGVDVHRNDSSVDCDSEEEDEEHVSRDLEPDSSP